jgi:endoglucanase
VWFKGIMLTSTRRLAGAIALLCAPSLLVGAAACGPDELLSQPAGEGSPVALDNTADTAANSAGGAAANTEDPGALIDDLEDGDLKLSSVAGRQGSWFPYDDTTEDGSLVTLAVVDDAAGGRALHATGSGFTSWGGGVVATFAQQADSYTGRVRFGVADGNTEPIGGTCSQCFDHFGADLVLTEEWQTFTFAWHDLAQLGWGDRSAQVDAAHLVYLVYQVESNVSLDLFLDDVAFLGEAADPVDTATGGAGGAGGATTVPSAAGEAPYEAPDPAVERYGQLAVVGTELRSEDGEPVQLKGVSSMWLNWESNGYAESAEALVWMRDHWGLEVIRAAMGVEESQAYLVNPDRARGQVTRIIENAIAAGVYVIVDWHTHHAEDYEAEALAFFDEMAQAYGEYPNVIWETYNEPLAVDWSTTLKPYHEHVVAQIREHDPDNLVVLGTPRWSQDVDVAAADPVVGTNLLYTLHFYACTHRSSLRAKGDAALAAGLPLFVTEWGATAADGGLNGVVCEDEALAWDAWMNENGLSWAAWKLDNCTPDSSCILATNAPVNGGWTTDLLHGHGAYVRDRMREP